MVFTWFDPEFAVDLSAKQGINPSEF